VFVRSDAKKASAQSASPRALALYAANGRELIRYDVSAADATLTRGETVMLPGAVQYAWPAPSLKHLYVVWSVGQSTKGAHGLTAFDVEPGTGKLSKHGDDVALKYRPIHVTVDRDGSHVLVVYNNPSAVTVFKINPDGGIGSEVDEPPDLNLGIYTHQVKVEPSNKQVIIIGRGNYDREHDPGSIHVYHYDHGLLSKFQVIAPGGGVNFHPRHLEFSVNGAWLFVSLEAEHMLQAYRIYKDGKLSDTPLFSKNTLANPSAITSEDGEQTGTVHVHPNGRVVYTANRGTGTVAYEGKQVFAGGENNIAVFDIDPKTGEPTLVQNIDTHGMIPRTFALDPSARILVAANQNSRWVRNGNDVTEVPESLALYKIRADGKLDFVRNYPLDDVQGGNLFWMGIDQVPQ
jgi:6-phosphogluconolactonase (cycloisomerase 2 family)